MSPSEIDLSGLQTEGRNPRSESIDRVSTLELCQIINEQDELVPRIVRQCLPVIAAAIDAVTERVRHGGRLIYVGAGTSGRLGVLDASEIPPTYSAPNGQFVAQIAGGDAAIRYAQEGAEDDTDAAVVDLKNLSLDPKLDSLIGIAASGRTPYVLSCLSYAEGLGCITIGVACSAPSAMSESGTVDYMISPVTGAEVVTGSTRMKAGTATKLVLNMLSTGVMIRSGKTFGNMMVDLKATNLKLKQRARNIIRAVIGPSCHLSDSELDKLLAQCNGSVKLALATLTLDTSAQTAQQSLEDAGGMLSTLLKNKEPSDALAVSELSGEPDMRGLSLCVDGGGSKCAAVVVGSSGRVGNGEAGPCNITDVGLNASIAAVTVAVEEALKDLAAATNSSTLLTLENVQFGAVWIGLAGYDRPEIAAKVDKALRNIFNISMGSTQLTVSNDIDMLATAVGSKMQADSVVVLLAGTGSVAMNYEKQNGRFIRNGRSGGWGHLLGDDGGGYDLGRQAIRHALTKFDEARGAQQAGGGAKQLHTIDPLSRCVASYFGIRTVESDLLSCILAPSRPHAVKDIKSRIASVARIMLEMSNIDPDAHQIMASGVQGLVRTLKVVLQLRPLHSASSSVLVLAGGLMRSEAYCQGICKELEASNISFKSVEVVTNPAILCGIWLAREKGTSGNTVA